MFGAIAAFDTDRSVLATYDGTVLTLDLERLVPTGQYCVYPQGPARVHISSCAVDPAGSVFLGDARNRRVRRFSAAGLALGLVGGRPNPGLEEQDEPGILGEPCALLPLEGGLLVANGGFGAAHGVQWFDGDGSYGFSFEAPAGGWKQAQGLARVGDEVWVAETDAGRIRRHAPDGQFLGLVALHPDLSRPFRLAADGFGGVLVLLAPETDQEQDLFGVARVGKGGTFEGWAVRAGEEAGVYCPYDLAVLPDGRFLVADLPLGKPPEMRLQLFSADGRLLATPVEGSLALSGVQKQYFESVLAREARDAGTLYEQARVHHYYAGSTPEHLAEAAALYRAALERDPGHRLAHLGLATLLQRGLEAPGEAEREYEAAWRAGGPEGDMVARMAECRREAGDLDGAIALLERAIGAADPPEDYHARVEDLGSYYLERAGESSGGMI